MIKPKYHWDELKKKHREIRRTMKREVATLQILESLAETLPPDIILGYSFHSLGETTIRVFLYPMYDKIEEKVPEDKQERTKVETLDMIEKFPGKKKVERYFRDQDGTFAYILHATNTDKKGEYSVMVFFENAFERDCKIVSKQVTATVFEATCLQTGEAVK